MSVALTTSKPSLHLKASEVRGDRAVAHVHFASCVNSHGGRRWRVSLFQGSFKLMQAAAAFRAFQSRAMFKFVRFVAVIAACLLGTTAVSCREPHWPETLTIGTASPGGTYFVYGEGLARLLTRELRTTVWARPTEGPTENITLIEAGEIELGFVTLGVAQQAWNGTGDWTNAKRFRAMRAVFPMYDTPFQFMALRDRGILSVADLSGKRVGIGPTGGTTGTYMPAIFKSLGMDAQLQTGAWSQLASKLSNGSLDGLAVGAGVPFPAFAEIERNSKVRYLPLTPSQIVALRLAMPELSPSVVAAGTYPSLLRHYQTVGLFNFAVAHSGLPDDLVYAIVEAVFAHHEEMMGMHPAAAETVPGNFTRNTFLPFHPGAAEWYHHKASTGVVRGD
jgi:TRAP transporter TAXI family solute receptor